MMSDEDPVPPGRQPPAEERIAHLARRAARGFSRSLQIRLAEHDITFGQWVFLRIMWDEEGLTQRELSERANLTEPTTHTALQKLEARGLVERRNLRGNRRRQHAFLTEAGHALRSQLEPLAIEVNRVALHGLPEADCERLRDMLLTIIANLDADERAEISKGRRMPPTRASAEG